MCLYKNPHLLKNFCPLPSSVFDVRRRVSEGKKSLADRAQIPGVHKNRECLHEIRSVLGLDKETIRYAGKDAKNKGLEDRMAPYRKVEG